MENSSIDSSLSPTRRISVGIGEYPIDWKTLTALICTSVRVVASDGKAELVSAVSTVEVTDDDALGQQGCVGWGPFTPGPDENPLDQVIHHHKKDQHGCHCHCLQE